MSDTPARRFVDADSAEVATILSEMARIVLRSGGALHPGLVMVERDGDMTVSCRDTGPPGLPLFMVPRHLLIPIAGCLWTESTEQMELPTPPPGLSPIQRDTLELHVALFNATQKIPLLMRNHPRAALAPDSDITASVLQLRPGFRPRGVAEPLAAQHGSAAASAASNQSSPGETPAELFLTTRVLGLAPHSSHVTIPDDEGPHPSTPASGGQSVLMTLGDLLNHHVHGAPYHVNDRYLAPAVAHPTTSDECFAYYGGRRDSLDLALHYGYADDSTLFVRWAPMLIDVDGFGSISVSCSRTPALHPLDPPRVSYDGETLTLSHLVFHGEFPHRWRVVVDMAVNAAATRNGASEAKSRQLADAAAEALMNRQRQLLGQLQSSTAAVTGSPAATMLAQVAAMQLAILAPERTRRERPETSAPTP